MKQLNGYVLVWNENGDDPAEFCKTIEVVKEKIKDLTEEYGSDVDNFEVYKVTQKLDVIVTDVVIK